MHFEGARQLVDNVRRLGEPWRFGLLPEEVRSFLAARGLLLEENLGADEYRERYLGLRSSERRGYAFYRIAVARVARAARSRAST